MMKKIIILLVLCSAAVLASCLKDVETARQYELRITVKAPAGEDVDISEISKLRITAVNSLTGEQTDMFPENGAVIAKVSGGEYNFRAIGFAEEFTVNGFAEMSVYDDATFDFQLNVAGSNGLIFKEVYMSGSKIGYGYWKDGFYEIYNNSNETLYLDGIILGIVDFNFGAPTPWVDGDGKLLDRYPMANFTVYFPGSGQDYPILPRESKVLATLPIDHTALEISEGDVPSAADLSNADWDIFIPPPYSGGDTDVLGIPNMVVAANVFGLDFMPNMSGQSIILAQVKDAAGNALYGDAVREYCQKAENRMQKPGSSFYHTMIPKDFVIDAIEIVYGDPTQRNKILHKEQDVGMTWYSGDGGLNTTGIYAGKSFRRKVLDFVDGKPVYQDTNNSSEDFILGGCRPPTPGVHPTEIDE